MAAQAATEVAAGGDTTALLSTLGVQVTLRSGNVRFETAVAAAEDAAAVCARGRSGRGRGRGDGCGGRGGRGGHADGCGGRRGERGPGACEGHGGHDDVTPAEQPEAAAKVQAEGEAAAAPEVAEEERWLREARRRADRAVVKAAAVAPSPAAVEAMRRMEPAEKAAAAVRLQAAVRGAAARQRWRHVLALLARYRVAAMAAVLAAETAAASKVEAQRQVAEVAVLAAETAAASRVEAERLEREAEGEEMAAALIQQAVRHAVETETRVAARRLVVVEASCEDADAVTQTDRTEVAEVGTQTAVFGLKLWRRVVAKAVQTENCDSGGSTEPAREVVVGRQLHPAQARAVERAERAAERVEQLQVEAEARAARYRMEGAAAQETAPTATTATLSEMPKAAVGSGGKQRKKAQLRRQAAAEGVDVRSWAASKAERKRQLLAEAWEGMLAPGMEGLDQRIGEEAAASRCFWEAARWHGEEGSRFSVLDAVE